jgi:hypothetical protein
VMQGVITPLEEAVHHRFAVGKPVFVQRQLMWTPHVSTINNSLEEIIAYLCTSSI